MEVSLKRVEKGMKMENKSKKPKLKIANNKQEAVWAIIVMILFVLSTIYSIFKYIILQ